MANFIQLYYYIKFVIKAILSLVYLSLTMKIFKYWKIEKQIIHAIKSVLHDKHNIVLITGGESLNKYKIEDLRNSYFLLNSYNTLKVLNKDVQELVLKNTLIYYQAPFHSPLSKEDYAKGVSYVQKKINKSAIIITNSSYQIDFKRIDDNNFEFRAVNILPLNFAKFSNVTGALFMINLAIHAKVKNLKVIGFDANWFEQDIKTKGDNFHLLKSFLFNYEILTQIRLLKHKVRKSLIRIEIPDNSWFNKI